MSWINDTSARVILHRRGEAYTNLKHVVKVVNTDSVANSQGREVRNMYLDSEPWPFTLLSLCYHEVV